MSIYARMMGLEEPKIPVHTFMAAMQEYMLNNLSGLQATAYFGLDATEQQEALALRDRILQESNANDNLQRVRKALEIENVLILAEAGVSPYLTVAAVKTRLGVV